MNIQSSPRYIYGSNISLSHPYLHLSLSMAPSVPPFKRLPIELRSAIFQSIPSWKDYIAFRCVDRINITIEPSYDSLQRFIVTGQPLSVIAFFHEETERNVLYSMLFKLCEVALPPYELFFPRPTRTSRSNELSSVVDTVHFYHGTVQKLLKTIAGPTLQYERPWLLYSKLLREAPRPSGITSHQFRHLQDLCGAVAENIQYSVSRVLFDFLTSPPDRDEAIMEILQAHGIHIANSVDVMVDSLSRLLESNAFQGSIMLQDFVGWNALPLVILGIAPSPCILALAESSVSDLLTPNTTIPAVQMPPAISPFGVILTSRFMNAAQLVTSFIDQLVVLGRNNRE